MGSCTTKISHQSEEPKKIIKILSLKTPITSSPYQMLMFPSTPKPTSGALQSFEAFGSYPSLIEEPFARKKIEVKGKPATEQFETADLAVICHKGLKAEPNQDNFCVVSSANGYFVGVFDGHGKDGHIISALARKILVSKVENLGISNIPEAFSLTNEEILKRCKEKNADFEFSGCTATFASIVNNELTLAYLGDSKALMIKSFQGQLIGCSLTVDHNTLNALEKKRIQNAGGILSMNENEGLSRVTIPSSPLGLAITRSFGDEAFKNFGVICTPTVEKIKLEPSDKFLVIATDGVWDVIKNYEIAKVLEKFQGRNACERISRIARNRWLESGQNTVDDITIAILSIGNIQNSIV